MKTIKVSDIEVLKMALVQYQVYCKKKIKQYRQNELKNTYSKTLEKINVVLNEINESIEKGE